MVVKKIFDSTLLPRVLVFALARIDIHLSRYLKRVSFCFSKLIAGTNKDAECVQGRDCITRLLLAAKGKHTCLGRDGRALKAEVPREPYDTGTALRTNFHTILLIPLPRLEATFNIWHRVLGAASKRTAKFQ